MNHATTQEELILDHLLKGKTLTAREAFLEWGILRLAARIYSLKQVVAIEVRTIRQGKRSWAQYRLVP